MGTIKRIFTKNKGVSIVLGVFILVAIGDLISTLSIGLELVKYLEANLFYKYIGIPGILLINVFYVWFIYYSYNKYKLPQTRFVLMNIVVTVILIRILIIFSNIQVAMNPPTIEMAMQVTQQMKTEAVIRFGSMAFLPFASGVLSFLLFKLDHKIECKEQNQ